MSESTNTRRGRLRVVPTGRDEADAFIRRYHRHHPPSRGAKFFAAVANDSGVVGVAVVGRPVARMLDDGWTVEVTRCCTDGTRNACSMLYAASWRAARALGYRKLITYTLPSEGGASLRAAGWRVVAETKAESWHREARPRVDTMTPQRKLRWEVSNVA